MGLIQSRSKINPIYAEGKNVIITGASCGIGAELARKFARQKANLSLVARNEAKLQVVAKDCLALGAAKAEIIPADLTSDEDIKKMVEKATKSFGQFDILVLNAGRSMGCYFEEIQDMDSINYLLKLNVNGVINTLMCALPAIPKSGESRIVVISSVSGLIGVPYRTIYCASKHALNGFCNALRIELRDTYGAQNSPKVQLINFPEVQGTRLNSGRMTMGAVRPPCEFKTGGSAMATCEQACQDLLREIEKGTDEWGQTAKFVILIWLRLLATYLADTILLKGVKRTHIRPDEFQEEGDASSEIEKKSQ